jgi:hypothetical protein
MGEPRFTSAQVVEFTGRLRKAGAAVTWDVPVQKNGRIPDAFVEQLSAIRQALTPAPSPRPPSPRS